MACTLHFMFPYPVDFLFRSQTVPYRPKTENEKPHFFIFSEFPTEKSEKKGLFSQFRATEKLETENLRFFIFGFRSKRNGLMPILK